MKLKQSLTTYFKEWVTCNKMIIFPWLVRKNYLLLIVERVLQFGSTQSWARVQNSELLLLLLPLNEGPGYDVKPSDGKAPTLHDLENVE